VAEHPGRRPARPVVVRDHPRAFDHAAGDRKDQRHRHIGRVLRQDGRRVGDGDAPGERHLHVDVVDAIAEIGDELEGRPRLRQHRGVDLVGYGRDEHVRRLDRVHELAFREGLVLEIEARVEELAHARFDHVRRPR
jgi:hypothetical protein